MRYPKLKAALKRRRPAVADPRSKKGVALFMVIVSMMLIIIVVAEIVMASSVDTKISRNAIHRLQAYYLANSSAKLSLLRLKIFKEASNALSGSQAGALIDPRMLDQLWSMPLPPLPIAETKETAHWPGKITANISSESSKIPINLLDGNRHRNSSPEIEKQVYEQVEALINSFVQSSEFDKLPYKGMETKALLFPLIDWIDTNLTSEEGGDENAEYDRLKPPYGARNDRLASLSELHLIQGWTDDFVDRFGPNFTILSYKTSVNPNQVSLNRIKSWGPDLSPEDLTNIENHRRLQPFGNLEELENYVKTTPEITGGRTFNITPSGLKSHTKEQSFVIAASGQAGDISRVIKLGVYLPDEYTPPSTKKPDPNAPAKDPAKDAKLTDPQVIYVEEEQ